MQAARRAVIVGGSMSGLLAAALLGRIGWDVDVFERSTVELVGRGAGITAHPELLDVLELSGAGTREIDPGETAATPAAPPGESVNACERPRTGPRTDPTSRR